MQVNNGSIVIGQTMKWETKQAEINGFPLTVEVADTQVKRMQGLQYRQTPLKDTGMLFVFSRPEKEVKMHMVNVVFPIDMIFIDPAGIVTKVHKAKPNEKDITAENVLYVVEAPFEWASKRGITEGVQTNLIDERTIDSLSLKSQVEELPVEIKIDKSELKLHSVNDKEFVITKDSRVIKTVHDSDATAAFVEYLLSSFNVWIEDIIDDESEEKEAYNTLFQKFMMMIIKDSPIQHKEELKRIASVVLEKQWDE